MTTSRRPPQAGHWVRTSAPVKRASHAMQRTTIRANFSASVVPEAAESGRVASTALVTRNSLDAARCGAPRNANQTGRIPAFSVRLHAGVSFLVDFGTCKGVEESGSDTRIEDRMSGTMLSGQEVCAR